MVIVYGCQNSLVLEIGNRICMSIFNLVKSSERSYTHLPYNDMRVNFNSVVLRVNKYLSKCD